MVNWIFIGKESVTLTGYSTYTIIERLPVMEATKRLEGETILRRFPSPFDHSIEICIIR